MALVDFFLKLDGIKGENPDHSITLESFSWGVSNATSSATGGAGSGKASFQDLSFRSPTGSEAPDLLMACANGKHIASGILTVSHKQTNLLTITFQEVFITSYKIDQMALKIDSDDRTSSPSLPMNNVSFNFRSYTFQTAGGSPTSGTTDGNLR